MIIELNGMHENHPSSQEAAAGEQVDGMEARRLDPRQRLQRLGNRAGAVRHSLQLGRRLRDVRHLRQPLIVRHPSERSKDRRGDRVRAVR